MKNIYLIKTEESDLYKIGLTKKKADVRLKELQTGNGEKLILVSKFITEFDYLFEKTLHRHFQMNKTEGEWFRLTFEESKKFLHVCETIEKNLKCLKDSENHFIK